ncbi:MAG: bifunctional 5,10-methylenetetrahydrofolate dehydrogenase/5,10-methenyltetrahydrofolate cyclohydrolase [Burkholderiales bacterium]|nr:bifunctional 5,10-methylenetetrahydrofolate dehydrogenase/5,10-methenyltetrahydrofolate cyclohydrolase [Burkholderiales bacterium]
MTAILLDGAVIARHTFSELEPRVRALGKLGVRPGLAAVCVGDDPASAIYVRNKVRACTEVGLHSEVHTLGANCTENALLEKLERINHNPDIHGVIVQLPLPRQLDAGRVQRAIAVDKDVDGFGWHHLGALVAGHPVYTPCTPLGVMAMLDYAGITIEGRRAVVVGRSVIVGKPMALLLISRGATVTVCNSKTPDLARLTADADILVAATGRAGLITADMVKTGAAVIDVGINRLPDGKITGDVDFAAVNAKAGWLTPVPGGVGRMTVAMLIANTVTAAERQSGMTPA